MNKIILTLILSSLTFTLFAKTESPYIGQQSRAIKALSEAEVQGYLNGKGLGFAKAAELNQFPGPRHVLDLAEELSLSEQQLKQSQALFIAMQQQAIKYGEKLVNKEQQLDAEFVKNSINPTNLEKYYPILES